MRQILDDPARLPADVITRIQTLGSEYRFLHMHLAFPDVVSVSGNESTAGNERTGWEGGFSVVLGNPPWERVKLQEKEFFDERDPDIAGAPNAAARKKLIARPWSRESELIR